VKEGRELRAVDGMNLSHVRFSAYEIPMLSFGPKIDSKRGMTKMEPFHHGEGQQEIAQSALMQHDKTLK
jgi:hypothetical protein